MNYSLCVEETEVSLLSKYPTICVQRNLIKCLQCIRHRARQQCLVNINDISTSYQVKCYLSHWTFELNAFMPFCKGEESSKQAFRVSALISILQTGKPARPRSNKGWNWIWFYEQESVLENNMPYCLIVCLARHCQNSLRKHFGYSQCSWGP